MTRTNAREIVAQLVYEMGFRDDDAAAVVREHLDPDYYATLKDESDAYQDRPTGKQAEYIQSTLCGIRERQEELDGYISKYAIGWNLAPSCSLPCTSACMCMTFRSAPPSTRRSS